MQFHENSSLWVKHANQGMIYPSLYCLLYFYTIPIIKTTTPHTISHAYNSTHTHIIRNNTSMTSKVFIFTFLLPIEKNFAIEMLLHLIVCVVLCCFMHVLLCVVLWSVDYSDEAHLHSLNMQECLKLILEWDGDIIYYLANTFFEPNEKQSSTCLT